MGHPDDFLDARLRAAPWALPDQHLADEHPWATTGWDASDDAHPAAKADVGHPELVAAVAEKSADPAPDVLVPDALIRSERQAAPAWVAAPCKPALVPSVEQSCAVVEQWVRPALPESPPRAQKAERAVRAEAQPPLLRWFPSAQLQAEVQPDEAEPQRQAVLPSPRAVPASRPAARAQPEAELRRVQAEWSAV